MVRIQNISDETNQRHTILLPNSELTLILRYHPSTQSWMMDLSEGDWVTYGVRVAIGCRLIEGRNRYYDFMCYNNIGNGLDPFQADDFSSGRYDIYMLEKEDVENIRQGIDI